jgi:HlyD family secretion protein
MKKSTENTQDSGLAGPTDISAVVDGLEQELGQAKRRRWVRLAITLLALGGLAFGGLYYRESTAPPPEPQFTTAALEIRDVIEEVQSTGVVEPVNQVEVGAQVSGRVVSVGVDFNDRVTQGQLLAEIDPELFGADVVQQNAQLGAARAAVRSSEARRDAIKTRLDRMRRLVAERVASEAELDQLQGEYDVSIAEVAASQSQIAQIQARLKSARTTLTYTKIFSPIDGVVIDRQVEPGQTVASSFNTPVLFLIARDLREMRVLAEIDEADVGKVKEGMLAEVTVDAFAEDRFEGKLTQIRLSPNKVEGVVTYSAVILVDNPDNKLRPGMTATVKIETRKAEQVLAVRNSALRFEPLGPGDEAEGEDGEDAPKKKADGPKLVPLKPGEGRVFLVGDGPPEAPGTTSKVVEVGISDGVWTELKSELPPSVQFIVDEKPKESKKGFRLF